MNSFAFHGQQVQTYIGLAKYVNKEILKAKKGSRLRGNGTKKWEFLQWLLSFTCHVVVIFQVVVVGRKSDFNPSKIDKSQIKREIL